MRRRRTDGLAQQWRTGGFQSAHRTAGPRTVWRHGVARTVARLVPDVPVQIKWPNDLCVHGRKLSGILCEMSAETDTVWHELAGEPLGPLHDAYRAATAAALRSVVDEERLARGVFSP